MCDIFYNKVSITSQLLIVCLKYSSETAVRNSKELSKSYDFQVFERELRNHHMLISYFFLEISEHRTHLLHLELKPINTSYHKI